MGERERSMVAMQGEQADKQVLRAQYRRLRDGLSAEDRARVDGGIARQLCAHPAYAAATTVFTYLSVGSEVDTRAFVQQAWRDGKVVAVPRCIPGTRCMEWYRIDRFEGLERSAFGIDEPAADPARRIEPDTVQGGVRNPDNARPSTAIAVVPGLAFDADGFRLGYGGGFYDVFLVSFAGTSIGLCRSAQMSADPLPRDAYDIPVDVVITEDARRVYSV